MAFLVIRHAYGKVYSNSNAVFRTGPLSILLFGKSKSKHAWGSFLLSVSRCMNRSFPASRCTTAMILTYQDLLEFSPPCLALIMVCSGRAFCANQELPHSRYAFTNQHLLQPSSQKLFYPSIQSSISILCVSLTTNRLREHLTNKAGLLCRCLRSFRRGFMPH